MKRELKWAAVAGVTALLLAAASVYADNTRTTTGSRLTYLLNGSPVYKGSIKSYDAGVTDNTSTNGGAGFTSFGLSNGGMTAIQCNEAALCGNYRADAGTLSSRELVRLAQYEWFTLGALQDGLPYVTCAPADAGTVSCSVFEYK